MESFHDIMCTKITTCKKKKKQFSSMKTALSFELWVRFNHDLVRPTIWEQGQMGYFFQGPRNRSLDSKKLSVLIREYSYALRNIDTKMLCLCIVAQIS